jgi:hypothetical protein
MFVCNVKVIPFCKRRVKLSCALLSTTSWRCIGSGGIVPHILNLGIGWRWVASFFLEPLCHRGKSQQCPLVEKLYRLQLFGHGVFMWQPINIVVTHIKNWQLEFVHKKLWNKLHELWPYCYYKVMLTACIVYYNGFYAYIFVQASWITRYSTLWLSI